LQVAFNEIKYLFPETVVRAKILVLITEPNGKDYLIIMNRARSDTLLTLFVNTIEYIPEANPLISILRGTPRYAIVS